METKWPADKGFEGMFLVGFRKAPGEPSRTERVGYAVVKRTYDLDSSGALRPSDSPLPVFIKEEPENLVPNSDFGVAEKDFTNSGTSIHPALWTARNLVAQRARTPSETEVERASWL